LSKVVRARYENGVLKPLEPLELTEGEEVILEVKEKPSSGLRRFFGIVKTSKPIREEDYYEHLSERGHIPEGWNSYRFIG